MKKFENNDIYIFCDFDGTITIKDLGDELFKEFGVFEPYNSQLKAGELNIYDYWKILCNSLKTGLTKEDIQKFSDTIDFDIYFKDFYNYCKTNDFHFFIISDGFKEYIEPVLRRIGESEIYTESNYLTFSDRISPNFPGASESCKCLCASCKRNAVLNQIPDNAITIYIGDGYSDFCAASHCDIIFAKKNLAKFCTDNKIPHYHFKTFQDIRRIFENILIGRSKLKIRRQAELLRKTAFETE